MMVNHHRSEEGKIIVSRNAVMFRFGNIKHVTTKVQKEAKEINATKDGS